MVLTGLLTSNQLLQTRQRAEGVDNHLAHIAIAAQIQLTLGDVTRVVGHSVGNVATAQGSNRNDGDRTATHALGELNCLLVDLCQVGIQRTGHRVLGRNLVHTVAHDRERVGIGGHVGKQNQYGLMLLHGKILGRGQCHIGNEQALHGRVLGGVDEGDDSVQRTCIGEGVAEEIVVIVGHTHTAQDNLVGLCTHGHHSHNLVERLVGVGKEGNLLTGYQGIVQVDTCNTSGDEFAGLLTAHGVHRGTADFHLSALNLRTSVDGMSVGIEETACQVVAHLQRGSLAKEGNLGIGGDTARTLKHLQGNVVAHNLYHLSQTAVDGCQFVIANALCLQ